MDPLRRLEMQWCADNPARLAELAGHWVVVEGSALVAHAPDPAEAVERARVAGVPVPYVFYVEPRTQGSALVGLL